MVVEIAPGLVAVIVAAVEIVKGLIPPRVAERFLTGSRKALLTLVVGTGVTMGGWALGFLPDVATWRDALHTGLAAAATAAGVYSMGKTTVTGARRRFSARGT